MLLRRTLSVPNQKALAMRMRHTPRPQETLTNQKHKQMAMEKHLGPSRSQAVMAVITLMMMTVVVAATLRKIGVRRMKRPR